MHTHSSMDGGVIWCPPVNAFAVLGSPSSPHLIPPHPHTSSPHLISTPHPHTSSHTSSPHLIPTPHPHTSSPHLILTPHPHISSSHLILTPPHLLLWPFPFPLYFALDLFLLPWPFYFSLCLFSSSRHRHSSDQCAGQAGGRLHASGGEDGGVLQQHLGDCMRWLLDCRWCLGGMPSAGLLWDLSCLFQLELVAPISPSGCMISTALVQRPTWDSARVEDGVSTTACIGRCGCEVFWWIVWHGRGSWVCMCVHNICLCVHVLSNVYIQHTAWWDDQCVNTCSVHVHCTMTCMCSCCSSTRTPVHVMTWWCFIHTRSPAR